MDRPVTGPLSAALRERASLPSTPFCSFPLRPYLPRRRRLLPPPVRLPPPPASRAPPPTPLPLFPAPLSRSLRPSSFPPPAPSTPSLARRRRRRSRSSSSGRPALLPAAFGHFRGMPLLFSSDWLIPTAPSQLLASARRRTPGPERRLDPPLTSRLSASNAGS